MTGKSFSNPLGNFIYSEPVEAPDVQFVVEKQKPSTETSEPVQSDKIGFQYSNEKKEIKSKRIQLVLTPSMYQKLKHRAKAEKASVNDFICQLLDKVL